MIPSNSIVENVDAILVIIDAQERLAQVMPRRDDVIVATTMLLRACEATRVPCVVTRQYPKGLGDVVPALADTLRHLREPPLLVDKVEFDCFRQPAFVDAICTSGRKQLVVCGMESHICVTQTVLAGLRNGYDVHVVADACCSRHHDSHETAMARLARAGAVVTTAESVAYELVGQAGGDEFKALLAAVKDADASRPR
jgi:nicotinamidase-related amidase